MNKREFQNGLKVETATHTADLPHQFVGERTVCTECAGEGSDPRHIAWERSDLADRERAQQEDRQVQREFG